MNIIDIAGVPINNELKVKILENIEQRLDKDLKTFVITPYSEFIYGAFEREETKAILSKADVSIADGMGVFIAYNFLKMPFKVKSFYGKIVEALMQMVYVLVSAFLKLKSLYKYIPEKIVGADFFWDLVNIAGKRGLSVYFLGGFNDTPQLVAEVVKKKYPNIKIAGYSTLGPNEISVDDINKAKADFLFVAYGPLVQEKWISQNLEKLDSKVLMGVGGTFDYITGLKKAPTSFIRKNGFEWLYRLFTQKGRSKRVWNATVGLIKRLIRFKVYESMPFRKNVLAVIIKNNLILVCKRKPIPNNEFGMSFVDYWQFPQGGLESNESIENGARREVEEETGLKELKFLGISDVEYSYKWHNARRSLSSLKKYRFKGQSQKIVYFELSRDEEVKLDNREFEDFKWIKQEDFERVINRERFGTLPIIRADLERLLKNTI